MNLNPEVIGKLRDLAQEVSEREGCRLYDLEFVGRGGQRTLRIFIDASDPGVTIDQCANVSRGLSLLLDVEDLIPGGKYELEVSSPGLERPLKETWQFTEAIGETIKVRTNAPIEFPEGVKPSKGVLKQLVGELKTVSDSEIVVHFKEMDWKISRDIIHKANVVFKFEGAARKQ